MGEIDRREKELESSIRKPAEAEKYKLEKMAEAHKNRLVIEAEAEAEAIALKGEADAWKEYKEAAMIDMMLQTLPKVAAEVAAPLSQTKKITMVSNGDGEIGAGRLTGEVLDIMTRVPDMVNKMTGVDITNNMAAAGAGVSTRVSGNSVSPSPSQRLRIR